MFEGLKKRIERKKRIHNMLEQEQECGEINEQVMEIITDRI